MGFPKNFVWGAATAAYQIEGAVGEDGRGPSVWDEFCKEPGAVWNGHTGEVACDHYHRYTEDIGLMKQIGLPAYRFSISWPRVLPRGTGTVNRQGLDFYNRLVDGLLEAGITPYATLFHWDLPQGLYLQDGWLNPASPDWFAEYTKVVVDALSDRVAHWMTFNEPNGMLVAGYQQGAHAPGEKLPLPKLLQIIHHILLAHGKATQAIRSGAKKGPTVTFVLAGRQVKVPYEGKTEFIETARQAMFSITDKGSIGQAWWLDPVYKGEYPVDGLRVYKECLPVIGPNDLKTIHQPLDTFSLNVYRGQEIRLDAHGVPEQVPDQPGRPYPSELVAWPLLPDAIYWGARFYAERYGLPIMITENGMSGSDWVCLDGTVHDPLRIDYMHRYLRALHRAGQEGVDIRAYFVWSLMDNFEWSMGYRMRFGLIHVDYQTQKRTLKDSAYWYQRVIQTNGGILLD